MKFRVFLDVAPFSLIGVDRRFRGTYYLHHQGDHRLEDGGGTHSESLVHSNETKRRYIPEDYKLHRVSVFENTVLSIIFVFKKDEVTG
jgi:hypothetical protein